MQLIKGNELDSVIEIGGRSQEIKWWRTRWRPCEPEVKVNLGVQVQTAKELWFLVG